METVNRKVTYKLYPTPIQALQLEKTFTLHQRLYNAMLEQRIMFYQRYKVSMSFQAQCRQLTELRAAFPEYEALNAQSLQVTAKRLDLAFQAFFRRVKAGEDNAGFPRFKSVDRFSGFGFKTYGDGWKLDFSDAPPVTHVQKIRTGKLRLSGMGWLRIRGMSRNGGLPKTIEIFKKAGRWFASVTYACVPQRESGEKIHSFDWGVHHFLTLADESEQTTVVENPRFLGRDLHKLIELQKELSKKQKGSKTRLKVKKRLANFHFKTCNRRDDFLHKESCRLVQHSKKLITEKLYVSGMTRAPAAKQNEATGEFLPNGAARKSGLNRSILDTSVSRFLKMVACKAEEAGIPFEILDTRKLKPSQRCSACGDIVRKDLHIRTHSCPCGFETGRDANSALVMLKFSQGRLPLIDKSRGPALSQKAPKGALKLETPAVPA